jgi:hypothetical protein
MAINPELITTIRVDQLPDEALSLTNLIPHSVGTDLKSATIQELVDLVATAIGVSGGVGYIAISVTDGQQLPDVPELPSFFLCGAGTFLNINGYPDVICTENLNAVMSLTDHWELAVEIPINPLSGTVQSVTGSAVDNTDPLNPVINSTGGGTPTLQEVTDEGNTTTNSIIVNNNENLTSFDINGYELIATDLGTNTPTFQLGFDGKMYAYDPAQVSFIQSLSFDTSGDTLQNYEFPNKPTGTYTLATTDDIPTGGGIPHATASGTDTYTATITGVTAYNDADAYLIRFTNGNTTGATLNINSLGAKTLYRNNDGALIGGDIISGGEMLCVYNSTNNHFQVIGTAPNSLFAYVTNDDSVTLTKGMPVYAFSGTGDRMTVKRAYNTTDATSAQTVGLVLSTSIAANQKGLIMMQGLLDGLSILPTSTFADGDAVYLGATAGTITNVKPHAPNHLVYLGVVTTASNGSAGRMYVRIQNGYELSEIHDIDLITNAPTNNQVLTYESSTDLWKNKSIGTILGYTPFRFVQTSQTAHTGTVAETIIATATINGGTFNSSDVMKVLFKTTKSNTSSVAMRLKINTTNTLVGATQIGVFNFTALANTYVLITRTFDLNGGNLYGYNFSSSLVSDFTAVNTAGTSTAYNTANTLYLFFTLQSATVLDTVTPNLCNINN